MKKNRLDAVLAAQYPEYSRELARAMIMSGKVFIAGQRVLKPGTQIAEDTVIEVRARPEYVSRGGKKLEKALEFFGVSPSGKVCVDCGASTGGFTDCLLKNGAAAVYAIDVGYGQLAWSLRTDPRVISIERTNIRYVTPDMFKTAPELAVIDVSFISLSLVLPAVRGILTESGEVICLIKPQFEAGRGNVGKKGIVRDAATHKSVLDTFLKNAAGAGFTVSAVTYSPVRGHDGNIEFLGFLRSGGADNDINDIDTGAIVAEAHTLLTGGLYESKK